MRKFILIFTLIVLLLSQSCTTDFDINAEYSDITIVYCLLNKKDSVHYARINKAFLGEGNALIMATDPANTLYPYEDLQVSMEEYLNDNLVNTYFLDTVVLQNKEEGLFNYPSHVLYAFNAQLNENCIYKLKIQNLKLGKLIEAQTPIVNDFRFDKPYVPPIPPPPQIYKYPTLSFIGTSPLTIEWQSAKNGIRYQVDLLFNYLEMNATDTVAKQIDWKLGTVKSKDLDGNETMQLDVNKESFYIKLKDNIPYNPNVRRRVMYIDFHIYVAGEEFNTYMEVNEPSTNLIQEKPEYTNISNGIGIFCSRFIKDELSAIDQRPIRFQLNPQSITELKTGTHTNQLGFID